MSTKTQNKSMVESGKEISLSEANSFIEEYNSLKKNIEITPKKTLPGTITPKEVNEFITSTGSYNAFIFSKDLIKRFFDENKGKEVADYLVIVLGAYFQDASIMVEDSIDSKKGAYTVLTTGCKKEEDRYKVVDILNPVNQYAPNMCISRLGVDLDTNSFNIIKK